MVDPAHFTLLLIRRFSPQSDQQIERIESIRTEDDSVQLAERRAATDPVLAWTHCAVIRPDGTYLHGLRDRDHIDWSEQKA
jgi:hypothetical protein